MIIGKRLGAVAVAAATLAFSLSSAVAAHDWRHDRYERREHARWEHGRHYRPHKVRVCRPEWRHHHRVTVCRYVYR